MDIKKDLKTRRLYNIQKTLDKYNIKIYVDNIVIDNTIYPIIQLSKEQRTQLNIKHSCSSFIKKKCANTNCNNRYYTPVSFIKKGEGIFCCQDCFISFVQAGKTLSTELVLRLAKARYRPDKFLTKICSNPLCAKEFMIRKRELVWCSSRGKYCSHHCRAVCRTDTSFTKNKRAKANIGKHSHICSEETKRKTSISCLNRSGSWNWTEKSKIKARIRTINYRKSIGNTYVSVGKHEKQLLDQYEHENKCKLIRQYYIKQLGYIVDGYCEKTNTVVEVYEKAHARLGKIKKDTQRQKLIEDILNCNFIVIWDTQLYKNKVA